MKSVSRFLCFLLVSTLGLAAGQSPFLLQSGVLVDPVGNKLFLMSPSGNLEARELASGQLLWKTEKASLPLQINGSNIMAVAEKSQGDGLEIVSLTANGEEQWRSEIPLPQDAWKSIDNGLGTSIYLASSQVQDDFVLWWQSENQDISGMAKPQNIVNKQDALVWNAQDAVFESRANLPTAPEKPGLTLVPAGEGLGQTNGKQWLSKDGLHILVSERIADNRVWDKYRWTVYEKATGNRIGDTRDHFSTAPFFVSGTTLVYVSWPYERRVGDKLEAVSLRLRAIDLTEGNQLWQQDIRDTKYRGPMPP